jgi:hypothetical protein
MVSSRGLLISIPKSMEGVAATMISIKLEADIVKI